MCTAFLSSNSESIPANKSQHNPIYIFGDSNFTPENGVVSGDGSASNPYIIENWEINATGFTYGIWIENTTAYFIIRNCTVTDTTQTIDEPSGRAIYLKNVRHGIVEHDYVGEGTTGIKLVNTEGTIIRDNDVRGADMLYGAILLLNSDNNTLINNSIDTGQWTGLYLACSNNNRISENQIHAGYAALYLEYANDTEVIKNSISGRLRISDARHAVLQENTIIGGGLVLDGEKEALASHEIASSNLVNGKPVYYVANAENSSVPSDAGQVIIVNSRNITIAGATIEGTTRGIQVFFSEGIVTAANTVENCLDEHIYLLNSTQCNVTQNIVTAKNALGICFEGDAQNNTVYANTIYAGWNGIVLSGKANLVLRNNIFNCSHSGISDWLGSENMIVENEVINCSVGIYSNTSVIKKNKVTACMYGILGGSHIEENNVVASERGIVAEDADVTILNNTIQSTQYGIFSSASSFINITANRVNAPFAVYILRGRYHGVHGNVLTNGGIVIDGGEEISTAGIEYWNTHEIDEENTVNGKKVYYYKDAEGMEVPSDAGQVIIANCSNMTLKNLTLNNASRGIQIGFSTHITISDAHLKGNDVGILFHASHRNIVKCSTIEENSNYGILFYRACNNHILQNNFTGNSVYAMFFDYNSSDNQVMHNTFYLNNEHLCIKWGWNNNITYNTFKHSKEYAIRFCSMAPRNMVYYNNFIENRMATQNIRSQCYDDAGNSWYEPTQKIGNYWSNWEGQGKYPVDGLANVFDFYPLKDVVASSYIEITHTSIPSIVVGHDIALNVYIKSLRPVVSANLWFKSTDATAWENTTLNLAQGSATEGNYTATIPAQKSAGTLLYYIQAIDNASFLNETEMYRIEVLSQLHINITLEKAEIGAGESVHIIVTVTDENHKPVPNVSVRIVLSDLCGSINVEIMSTDANGTAIFVFTAWQNITETKTLAFTVLANRTGYAEGNGTTALIIKGKSAETSILSYAAVLTLAIILCIVVALTYFVLRRAKRRKEEE